MEKLLQLKNSTLLAVLISSLLFFSCVDDAPTNYTSIKGGWRCIESSPVMGERTYLINIEKVNNDRDEYLISNFHRVGDDGMLDIKVVVKDSSIIDIKDQPLGPGQQLKSGYGIVDSTFTQMTINYLVFNGSSTIGYTAVYSR